ncbi:MAG: fatty acyl-AMP ligase [Moorea sp. SIO1G6]|uniref:fatty acyl-AMP ligase n=1 Tax=Moorena sp. SIO1G6 TaxID=2607840 RepID=UPI0013C120B9|nr:fatty acyl-AMP ligase [Moorena sp. SIO1G6]
MANHKPKYSNLVDLVVDRALHQPNQIAYTFLADGETESGHLTYQQLDQQARAIAAQLQSLVAAGSRALLVYPYTAGLEFIAAFFGCLYASVVAVTANPPRSKQAISQLQQRVISSQSTVALTTTDLWKRIQQQCSSNPELAPTLTELSWIETNEISPSLASDWIETERRDQDSLAFLQYTSGSTGKPKGVMVTHGNILHNSASIYQSFEHTLNSQAIIWLPLFHDMGLIGGVIQPIYGRFPVILMSPVALIQKPVRWLQAISRYKARATTSGGPNFAYDLLCRQVTPEQIETLDLSSWEVAFSGAEPVRAETLERFANIFAPCGFRPEAFYPCYGMAETTLFISGGLKANSAVIKYVEQGALGENRVITATKDQQQTQGIVSCGQPWLDDQLVIVDPETLIECPENKVGEIWVSGLGVGKGYWNQPEETERTFGAYIKDTGTGPFLRTGDLGFLKDGELFITGRLKELMILWGNNRYPQHIEATVEKSHPALRPNASAAFSVDLEGEERLVIAQEIKRSYLRHLVVDEVVAAIRQAVAQEHIADVYGIVLLKTGSIPKTSSGKIKRRECRLRFLDGTLEAVGKWQQSQQQPRSITDLLSQLNVASSES